MTSTGNADSQNGRTTEAIDTGRLGSLTFEVGAIRPPSEGGSHSLLLRVTRNCSWNRCKFCYGMVYGRKKFELRSVEEVNRDIDTGKTIVDDIKSISWQVGLGGRVTPELGSAIIRSSTDLRYDHCFIMVFNWLCLGAKTVFLQDANTVIMPTAQLLAVLRHLTGTFPTIERITSYARSKTIAKKSPAELKDLRAAGLSRLHVGLETGDDELLTYMDKGVTAAEHIDAGKKAKAAGFELSEYVMIDLGGRARWEQHAKNTAHVLNEIDPDFIRFRPFMVGPHLPLYEEYMNGTLVLSSPHERLRELKMLVENLNVTSRLCFDHFLNAWYTDASRRHNLFRQDYAGYKFPEEKERVIELIEEGLKADESTHMHVNEMVNLKNL
jgi:radical SAM superfamily enzyme YgiQ (UPF0313 family)